MKFRQTPRSVLAKALALYSIVFVIINYLAPPKYIACDLYTKEMNGGIRTLEGKSYKIVLCGYWGNIGPDGYSGRSDQVRLQIFSEEGDLLAQRYFEPVTGLGKFGIELRYGTGYLIYNDGEGPGFQTRLAMPPTRLEWIRARLPRFVPLVFWP